MKAFVEGNDIVVRVSVSVLATALAGSRFVQAIDSDSFQVPVVFDPKVFAKSMVSILNEECEQGNTPLIDVFDKAMEKVIEQELDGFEMAWIR